MKKEYTQIYMRLAGCWHNEQTGMTSRPQYADRKSCSLLEPQNALHTFSSCHCHMQVLFWSKGGILPLIAFHLKWIYLYWSLSSASFAQHLILEILFAVACIDRLFINGPTLCVLLFVFLCNVFWAYSFPNSSQFLHSQLYALSLSFHQFAATYPL